MTSKAVFILQSLREKLAKREYIEIIKDRYYIGDALSIEHDGDIYTIHYDIPRGPGVDEWRILKCKKVEVKNKATLWRKAYIIVEEVIEDREWE